MIQFVLPLVAVISSEPIYEINPYDGDYEVVEFVACIAKTEFPPAPVANGFSLKFYDRMQCVQYIADDTLPF